MKKPTKQQKIDHYERFLHMINLFMITGSNEGIKQLLANADNWSYAHRAGQLTDKEREKLINEKFHKLLDIQEPDAKKKLAVWGRHDFELKELK